MAKLVKAVHVKDPDRNRRVLLLPGEEPEPRLAALVTNPGAWEDGKPPATDAEDSGDGGQADTNPGGNSKADGDGQDQPKQAAPAAKKTAAKKAAPHRSRGRDAAGEGTSGE